MNKLQGQKKGPWSFGGEVKVSRLEGGGGDRQAHTAPGASPLLFPLASSSGMKQGPRAWGRGLVKVGSAANICAGISHKKTHFKKKVNGTLRETSSFDLCRPR